MSIGPTTVGGEAGGHIEGVRDFGRMAIGASTTITKNTQQFFAAMGFEITENATGVVTVSYAQQDATTALGNPNYTGKIKAMSASASVHFQRAFLRFLHERGYDTELMIVKNQSTHVHAQDFDTFVRNTTITTETTTATLWEASQNNAIMAGFVQDIGDNVRVTFSGGVSKKTGQKPKAQGSIDMTYYGKGYNAGIGVQAQNKSITTRLHADVQLSKNASVRIA